MEIAQLQEILNKTSQAQNETQPPVPIYKIPDHIYFFIYHPSLKYLPFVQTFLSSEGSISHQAPFALSNFILKPTTAYGDLESELYSDENTPFGVLGQILQAKFSSLSNSDLAAYISELKQTGDLKEVPEEQYKYLYKVGDLFDGPILTLTKSNTIFSGQASPKVSTETLKSDGRTLVEDYYRWITESFGEETGFSGLNHLRKGYEQSIEDGFLLKHLFDNYMKDLSGNSQLEYKFEKGSTDKMDFEIEIEKFAGGSLWKIPALLEATGNFDWNHPREFNK